MEDRDDDAFQTEQRTDPEAKPPNTPPADEPSENALGNSGKEAADAPPSPGTEPTRQVPHVPPTYPIRAAPPGGPSGYYAPPIPARPTSYAASAPLPPYQAGPGMYQPADSQRGLRAATKLALSADVLQGGAILWVDDHPEWNEPLIRLFRTAGITVDPVASTDEAVRALQRGSYDLVITDMRREREPDGDTAGTRFLDQMVASGVPTPAVIFTGDPIFHTTVHPRVVTVTNSPEILVDAVVDVVSARRVQSQGSSWLDRFRY
jgi:CheY-like chemotaxis protein